MRPVPTSETHSLTALIKSLLNAQLKSILRHEHLAVSGVKNVLQFRILTREFPLSFQTFLKLVWVLTLGGLTSDMHKLADNPTEFDRLKKYIYYVAQHPMPNTPTPSPSAPYPHPSHSGPQALPANRPPFSTTMTPPHSATIGIYEPTFLGMTGC